MDIERKLDAIFRRVGIEYEGNENLREENLLGRAVGLKARDLVIVYFEIEKAFHIQIPEKAIVNGEFNTYWKILDIVRKAKGIE